jgi:O-methyltransferase involved in polyketide biosynthesis
MNTIEMIDRIANHFPTNSAAWLQVMDLRARVESERAALQEAVEEIHTFAAEHGISYERDDIAHCADIIAEKTGVTHAE